MLNIKIMENIKEIEKHNKMFEGLPQMYRWLDGWISEEEYIKRIIKNSKL